ncbi:thioredoxin domain-containing protein [Candidatus Giovannonibacteria bacterium]|nr:thioredoxin domain-containing protein [Candidatus Giovannonibacteria bacterium]
MTVSAAIIVDVDIKNEPFIGDPNAPVTIAYWSDFQCPFCQRFEQNTLPTLVDQYVKTGKVKIVFKDFQFLGPDSQDAFYRRG